LLSLEGLDEEDYEWFRAMLSVRSKRRIVLVAEQGGKVVGFVLAYKYRENVYIDGLAVHPECRGLGIGGKLLSVLEEILTRRNVERVLLSVKDSNLRALDFYLKKGYSIRGLILFMSIGVDSLPGDAPEGYGVVWRRTPLRSSPGKYKPTTMWSELTEPVDRMIYRKYRVGENTLAVYKSGRVRGVAEFSLEDGGIFAEYVALSSYNSLEALRALLKGFRDVGLQLGSRELIVPVDSSKQVIVEELANTGFKTQKTEFLLEKGLDGSQ
jgi:ribosomal protein S18 acetylase RimI-like enzyme